LLKLHKQSSDEIKKIITALLLKIPNFSNLKAIAKDIDPEFISLKTMRKHTNKLR
jgi:predicted AAA+ superfamily ATPase